MFLVFFVVFLPVARLHDPWHPQDPQEIQDPQDFQDLKDLQDPRDLKDLPDFNDIHDPWDTNDPLDLRDFQDPQKPQDLQDPQDFQDPWDLQEPQYVQDPQELQDPQDLQDRQDQDPQDQCPPGSCTPPLGDLMVGRAAQLSASSTCGLEGPENYCILGYLEEDQKCFLCDSRLLYSSYSNTDSHRVENLITTFDPDRKLRWWQSENGVHGVSVRLDLETVFQFSHLVLTFKSFRPAAMLVERSQDFGRSWKVFRYFSEDCSLHFPLVSNQPAGGIEDVVCDGRYSGPEPSTEGEVVLKALDPIFHIENPYAANVQDLITLTNIRVNFTRLFTLGDTLSRRRRNPRDKYYYAVYDMVVRGSCFCHGHAHRCRPVDGGRGDVFTQSGMVHGQCVCQHNTAGENCERCRDFHHDSPWRPGGATTAGLCRRCHCHGHSDSCHFDAARFEATGRASGGVCDACRHNRAGPQCELCGDFLYRDPQRAPEDPHACIPCDCDPAGSLSGGLCEAASGRCVCKENIEGRRCDNCKPGFFNRRQDDPAGCQACGCHVLGSLSCDQLTGSCECNHLARGPLCDQCPAGFWGLGVSGYRCSPCDCDIGGAHSTTCSLEDGQCQCLPNMGGRRCSEPTAGHFLPPLDYFLYEAELAAPLQGSPPPPPPPPPSTPPTPPPLPPTPSSSSPLLSPLVLPRCEQIYREQGYDFKVRDGVVVLVRRTRRAGRRRRQNLSLEPGHALQIIPRQRAAGQLITWTGLGFVRVLEGAGLRFTVDNLPSSMDYQLVIRYEPESPSDWLASVSAIAGSPGNGGCRGDPKGSRTLILPGNSRGGVLDSPLCLNADARYLVDVVFNKQPDGSNSNGILIDSMGLIPSIESVQDFCSQTDLDSFRRFRCIGLAAELDPQGGLPEVCEGLVKSMSARIHRGAVRCRCNAAGSLSPSCSKLGGVCECKPNVIGRCCDACAPLTFGFGPDGCQPCECHAAGSDPLCEQVRGQCSCRRDIAGRRCDRCRKGFWGFPLCRPCECNGLSDECEEDTGECVECREDATGPHCDRCMEGFYGDPVSRRPCEPCLCPGVQGSGRFFATSCRPDPESLSLSCDCRPGHSGPRCDRCSPGFYGDLRSPGAGCERCLCNNNILPEERDACDAVTGVCQRCLHGTGGEQCQHCRAGYYGDALLQDCKECTCERRGTEVTQCPEGSPCVCDPQTGQCPCRGGVQGVLCDQCEDEYWNLGRGAGCQPCSCDTANAFSNTCNKVTGQCPCHAEFGGRQCDECGENHFGNPDLQCFSCDCNLEGTEPPSCDPETGECLCREGVSGIFCDECSPGYDSAFPLCAPCHTCRALWAQQVEDVQRAAHTMKRFIPRHDDQRPIGGRPEQRMLQLQAALHLLGNLTGDAPPRVEQVEQLRARVGKLQDGLDLNRILMDPSALLHTELDNIGLEFKKLLNNLKDKTFTDQSAGDMEDEEGLLDEIQNQHGAFLLDEKKVRKAITAVEGSMDTRQEVKRQLSACSRSDLEPLERRVLDLRVGDLNRRVCGASDPDVCSGCGGALCALDLGGRKCGGPNCDGVFPVSQEASETAEGVKDKLSTLPKALQDANTKIDDAKREAQLTRGKAKDLQDQINSNIDSLQREKDKTKVLLQRVRDYLIDEMVPPEDIEKMARAVLDIKLPRSPNQTRSLINDINNLLFNTSSHQDSLENLADHARTAQDLLKDARELKERTETVDLSGISRDLYEAERAQDKANDQLDTSSGDRDRTRDQIQDMRDKLEDMETKMMSRRPEGLQDQIQALKEKTDQNRETAGGAGETAESAVKQSAGTQPQLDRVLSLFEVLQLRNRNRKGGDAERLKNLLQEAEDMKTLLQDKLNQIQGIEQRMEELLRNRSDRAGQVSDLLLAADALRREIFSRAEGYAICTS